MNNRKMDAMNELSLSMALTGISVNILTDEEIESGNDSTKSAMLTFVEHLHQANKDWEKYVEAVRNQEGQTE